MLRDFVLTFIPLFVAVDPIGVLPVYLRLVSSVPEVDRRAVVIEATLTGAAIGASFVVLGHGVLDVLGIGVEDVQIAGGVLLLVLAVYDVLHPEMPLRQPGPHLGTVPLGTPLIVGPAVLTTLLALPSSRGYQMTLIAFALNMVLVSLVLRWASVIERVIGEPGSRAVAKVFNLLLAAIGVHMIRLGVEASFVHTGR